MVMVLVLCAYTLLRTLRVLGNVRPFPQRRGEGVAGNEAPPLPPLVKTYLQTLLCIWSSATGPDPPHTLIITCLVVYALLCVWHHHQQHPNGLVTTLDFSHGTCTPPIRRSLPLRNLQLCQSVSVCVCVCVFVCVCVWSVSPKAYGPTQHVSFEFGGVILVDPRQHIYPATGGSLHT